MININIATHKEVIVIRTISEKVDHFEEIMKCLAYAQLKTETELQEFKDEMKEFKEEMKEFKDCAKKSIEFLNKRWGNLANKMGTLVEDIFAPSIDIIIEKYFGVKLDDVSTNRLIRKGVDSLEIDILGISHDKRKAFVVEVKASPDRVEYIERFVENTVKLREFLPFLEGYEIIPIYAGLNMKQETIKELTKRKIYALIMQVMCWRFSILKKSKNKAQR